MAVRFRFARQDPSRSVVQSLRASRATEVRGGGGLCAATRSNHHLFGEFPTRDEGTRAMKVFCAVAAVGLMLVGSLGSALSQPWGGRGYGYGERDYEYRDRGYRHRERGYGFDPREYLRCNPDVRRSVMQGQTTPLQHYQTFGIREGRRLSC